MIIQFNSIYLHNQTNKQMSNQNLQIMIQDIIKNRENINKWFGARFLKERQLKEYKGIIQGSHVDVDFSNIKTRKYKDVDSLLVIALIPQNDTFIGMTGAMNICQVPLNIIIKNK